MADEAELRINDKAFIGWTDINISLAMDAACGAFTLGYTERWPGSAQQWAINKGDECEVWLAGEQLISGYVDRLDLGFSDSDHSLSASGRDKSADIVDCSADFRPDQWKNITTLALGQILAKPFGIRVYTDLDDIGAPIPIAKITPGETTFAALARFCAMRKQLLVPDGLGGLVITRAGVVRAITPLVSGPGGNILTARGTLDDSKRFSHVRVKAQAPYNPDDDGEPVIGESEAHIEGTAIDEEIAAQRYRPLVIMAESAGTPASVKDRAEWEVSTRIGNATEAEVTIMGWRQRPDAPVWRPNRIVPVRSDWLKIHGDMLIKAVNFRKSVKGTYTSLSLVSPLAYVVKMPKLKKDSAKDANPWLSGLSEARQ